MNPIPRSVDAVSVMRTPAKVVSAKAPPRATRWTIPRSFRASTLAAREKYAALYEEPVWEDEQGTRVFDRGILYRCHGLNILFLKGDYFEMAFQHGRLLFDQIPHGALLQSARTLTASLVNALGVSTGVAEVVAAGIHQIVTRTMVRYAISATQHVMGHVEAIQDAIALSEATGLSVQTLTRALCNPEILLLLASRANDAHGHRVRLLDDVVPPACCCSSFAAWGGSTVDGRMVIGRNLDYPLNGFYDRFPTVIYCDPSDPAGQKSVACVSAGVQNSGVNGYNESGIFIASHTVPTIDVSARGVPVFTTANQVLRYARTFDAAMAIFSRFPPPTGWAYLVASTRERRVATVELNHRQVKVRESVGEFHVQTNHYLTSTMQASHLFLNRSVCEDNDARYLRIQERLRSLQGKLDVPQAIAILGDQADPLLGIVRGLGNTVGVPTTMSSMVLDPDKGSIYVSSGPAPACHQPFVELPLPEHAYDKTFDPTRTVITNDTFRCEYPQIWEGIQRFIQAKIAYEVHGDEEKAYQLLRQVVDLDRDNAAYWFQLGIFAIKTQRDRDALIALQEGLECDRITSQLRRLMHYYRGRILAHRGMRADALVELQYVLDDSETDNKLRQAAHRAFQRTGARGRCHLFRRSLAIMMQQSDMLNY